MGCGASKQAHGPMPGAALQVQQMQNPMLDTKREQDVRKPAAVDFELLTPMLVMPFKQFKRQGRIAKSTVDWRKEAFAHNWLVQYTADVVCVFVSHRWWHDPPGRPQGEYDWGGPDYVEGDKANLKSRLICQAVDTLVQRDGLDANKVAIWIDWQVRLSFSCSAACPSAKPIAPLPSRLWTVGLPG